MKNLIAYKCILESTLLDGDEHKVKEAARGLLALGDYRYQNILKGVKNFGRITEDRPLGLIKPRWTDFAISDLCSTELNTLEEYKKFIEEKIETARTVYPVEERKKPYFRYLFIFWLQHLYRTMSQVAHTRKQEEVSFEINVDVKTEIAFCNFGKVLCNEWLDFATFYEDAKGCPNYSNFVREQFKLANNPTDAEIMAMEQYIPSTIYYNSRVIHKETLMFLTKKEIELYIKQNRNGISSVLIKPANVESYFITTSDLRRIVKQLDEIYGDSSTVVELREARDVVGGRLVRYLPTFSEVDSSKVAKIYADGFDKNETV